MPTPAIRAHAALAGVHAATALLLTLDGAYAHAACTLATALIYAALCRRR